MNITIFATGSRGDIQPYVALGVGLLRRHHHVRFASFSDAAKWMVGTGIEFFPLAADFDRFLKSESGTEMMATQNNLIAHVRAISAFSRKLAESPGYWESYETACDGADLIIYSVNAPQGFHLAEKLRIPTIGATHLPVLSPTATFASPMWPVDVRLGGLYNRFTHRVVEQFMWRPFREIMNDWRRTHLNLPPISWRGPFAKMRESLIIYGCSPLLVPKPDDWNALIQVTGYWHQDPATDWQPPGDLVDFLRSGPKPVYIGFGSMGDRQPEDLLAVALGALQRSHQRGLLQMDWTRLDRSKLPENAFALSEVPYDWLFPQLAAAVHHGGAGTTAVALRAGIPSVVVPFFSDQPFWARRLELLGVAPPAILRRNLNVERLSDALLQTAGDAARTERAASVGERVRQENGVQTGVEAIHRHLGW